MADPSVIGVNATRPVCDGTCSLDFTESEPQRVDTPRCPGNGGVNGTLATNTGIAGPAVFRTDSVQCACV